jgi:hypothetical protein
MVRPHHLKLLETLKQRLVLNLPYLLNNILHEVARRTQKAKDLDSIINDHGLVKLIVVRALNHTQIMWEGLIDLNRPLQIEQPQVPQLEIHLEIPPQGIEIVHLEGESAQTEILATHPEIETKLIQLAEEQSKEET